MLRQCILTFVIISGVVPNMIGEQTASVRLPKPARTSSVSLEQTLHHRRSIREYKTDEPLSLQEVSQLLWAAQGVTSDDGLRTAPSAGALYPLEVYVVAGNVRNLQPGIYHYRPREHELVRVATGDKRRELSRAALDQEQVRDAPAVIAFSAVFERTTGKYRERGRRYVHIEVGHASQNVLLQAVSLGLGAVPVGAFSDEEVKKVMSLPEEEEPMYLMPIGRR